MCVVVSKHSIVAPRRTIRVWHHHPWVETHGYHQMSLHDGWHLGREVLRRMAALGRLAAHWPFVVKQRSEQLREYFDQCQLIRANAAAILNQRGIDVD